MFVVAIDWCPSHACTSRGRPLGRALGSLVSRRPGRRIHDLRHTAAASLRRAGAPLFEIGQLLRHQHAVTTAGYARDDEAALAELTRRWPGGAA